MRDSFGPQDGALLPMKLDSEYFKKQIIQSNEPESAGPGTSSFKGIEQSVQFKSLRMQRSMHFNMLES